jgi:Rrf2 family transcriptional regulator, iron-sulfur cluster assembly transcription factor
MLKFSKKVDYGLQAMLHMAGSTELGPVSAREIAAKHDIPLKLTAKLLQQLTRQGLCESRQGPSGGYLLTRPAEQILLGDVLTAIEGEQILTRETGGGEIQCDLCHPLAHIQLTMHRFISKLTLADLISGVEVEFKPASATGDIRGAGQQGARKPGRKKRNPRGENPDG